MFSWRFRLVTYLSSLSFAAGAFLLIYLLQDRSLDPSWPYFVAILIAAVLNQFWLILILPKVVRQATPKTTQETPKL